MLKKLTFHKDDSKPNGVLVFVNGEPATADELDKIVQSLNSGKTAKAKVEHIADDVQAAAEQGFKECKSK